MKLQELLQCVKECLQTLYGDRFKGLILYGSEAIDKAQPDSDIDLLCLLEGPISIYKEIRATTDATYPLQLEHLDRMLHIMPVDAAKFNSGAIGFYRIVQREGKPI
ncbi:MAG: nucleotidyltransferase domain-containing protein [bacterium]